MGAFDYLMKPTQIDELVYKIQDAFRMRELREKKYELESRGAAGS